MIRKATKYDKPQIIDMLKMFRDEAEVDYVKQLQDETYIKGLLDTILAGAGVVFLDDNKGFIMALITHTAWDNKTYQMYELAWYVIPQFRNTTLGYRLLKQYVDYGNELKNQGRIKLFTIAKMPTSPDIKYDRFGFKKMDETWVQ
jgi:N-acetylglutamate synthase-like GNAT family acetyltransferase